MWVSLRPEPRSWTRPSRTRTSCWPVPAATHVAMPSGPLDAALGTAAEVGDQAEGPASVWPPRPRRHSAWPTWMALSIVEVRQSLRSLVVWAGGALGAWWLVVLWRSYL